MEDKVLMITERIKDHTMSIMRHELTQYGFDIKGKGTDEYEHANKAYIAAMELQAHLNECE
tara:strand:+ start:473 stop:655 length:183 start_codon:yes stop_codon:yes gene_type:complete